VNTKQTLKEGLARESAAQAGLFDEKKPKAKNLVALSPF
jgi:hypothetical protein